MTCTPDAVRHVQLSTATLPLSTLTPDAEVPTGRKRPMTEVVLLLAEIAPEQGHSGVGFSCSKRAGLPLAKLLGAHRDSVRTYNTSGGFLNASLEEGTGGITIEVGLPDPAEDLRRVAGVREQIGTEVALMVDTNQQWDRATALRMGRRLEEFGLARIEEPLDADDTEGHAPLTAALDTPIATGEMLASVSEHVRLIEARSCDVIRPDAPRVGGITQFLRLAPLADQRGLGITLSEQARAWTTDTVGFGTAQGQRFAPGSPGPGAEHCGPEEVRVIP